LVLASISQLWNRAGMVEKTLAIHGHGLLPGLLAVHLLNQDPGCPILLLCADQALGGAHLEPVVASRLSPVARDLIEPFVVSSWPAYYLIRAGTPDLQEDEVLLLDPMQVWLELQGRLDASVLVAPCGRVELDGELLSWDGGSAKIGRMIDLDPLIGRGSESEIVGVDAARRLTLPVLADYDAACDEWSARQYLPLGDERLVVRKLPRAEHLIGQQSTFEMLLNGLTAT
jgi:hypothetical protein